MKSTIIFTTCCSNMRGRYRTKQSKSSSASQQWTTPTFIL